MSHPSYIKHLIQCKCFLPQFKDMDPIPFHKFIVFSELDEEAKVKRSYAQCNNCGIVHKITEIGKSEMLAKDSLPSLPTIEDIKTTLPEWLSGLLEKHLCDFATWQEAKHIVDKQLWGTIIILSKERIDEEIVVGKYLEINGKDDFKIESFEQFDGLI
jgi:hypothetical protein